MPTWFQHFPAETRCSRDLVDRSLEMISTPPDLPLPPRLSRKSRLIADHYLFADLDTRIVDRIAGSALLRPIVKNDFLFRKGDEGDALYGVLQGKIAITTQGPKGKTNILNLMEPGDFFGEIAFLDGQTRTADAYAIEDSEVLQIYRRDFYPLLDAEPVIAKRLIELLCERLRWTSEAIEDAHFLELSARLAKCFLRLAIGYGRESLNGTTIDLMLTQEKLAQMMGASREAVNKELRSWETAGWLAHEDGHYTIRDQMALRSIVRSAWDD